MPFTESTKQAVRRKAHGRCCICNAWDVEVHHIIPQEENGPDDEDNAAPLCGTCHNQFGGNPAKRKVIREARDHWYEICSSRFTDGSDKIEEVSEKIDELTTIVLGDAIDAVGRSQQGEFRFIGGPFEGKQQLVVNKLPEFLGMPVGADRLPARKRDEVWGSAMHRLQVIDDEVAYVFLRFQANNPDASTPIKLCSNRDLAEELASRVNFWGLIISSPDDRSTPPVAGDPIVSHSKLNARQQLGMVEALLPELRRRALYVD